MFKRIFVNAPRTLKNAPAEGVPRRIGHCIDELPLPLPVPICVVLGLEISKQFQAN